MRSTKSHAVVAAALAIVIAVQAQEYGSTGSYGNTTLLCNSTITNANASGVFTFPVGYPIANQSYAAGSTLIDVPNPSWAITVDVADDTTQTSIWYDTAGQNYSNDLSLNYDVCAYILGGLPINTLQLGQEDDGSCSSMFSQDCISAITLRAAESALMWVSYSTPPPYQNLTAGVLPSICSYITSDLKSGNSNWPEECSKPFGVDADGTTSVGADIMALTGYNASQSLLASDPCTLQSGNKTFRGVSTTLGAGTTAAYDNATREIYPILSIYMPVANVERTSFNNWANSSLQCVRARDFGTGSRVSPALPAGTPYDYSKGLSGGAIGGIVVGVVVGLAIVVGLSLWWFCWKPRRRKADEAKEQQKLENGGYSSMEQRLPEAGGESIHELSPHDRKPEVDGTHLHEMSAVDRKAEIDSTPVAEMDGGHGKAAELTG